MNTPNLTNPPHLSNLTNPTNPTTLFVWVAVCLIWSTVWLFIKMGVTDVPPVGFAAVRLMIAFAVLGPVALLSGPRLPRRPREWVLIMSTGVLLLGVNYALLYWGLQFISSGLTAVLQATVPLFGLLFAHRLLPDERITPLKLGAMVLGIGGVAVIFAHQIEFAGRAAFVGSIAVVGGAVCVALAYVVIKAYGNHLHPSVLTAGQMASALVPMTLFATLIEGNPFAAHWTARAVVSVFYLALAGSVSAAWLNYWLLKRMGASKVLLMNLVEPLIAVALGAAVLGETFTARTAVGGVCILISVALGLDLIPLGKRQRS